MATNSSANLGFEDKLWAAADKLRGTMDAAEYKHVVLGLIFLKYISDSFLEKYAALKADKDSDEEDRDEYLADNVFWVPPEARWDYLQKRAKDPKIGQLLDDAMSAIERDNTPLKGVLPREYARPALDKSRLGELIDLIATIGLGDKESRKKDILGRVYEYFLKQFAEKEGKGGGEFYTPQCVVKVLVEMLLPYVGRVYDPCCGSGGMFVQAVKFVEAHSNGNGNGSKAKVQRNISIYGQESNYTTWRLALMNLAIRGIDAHIQWGDTFVADKHRDLKADFIIANPPFNDEDWGYSKVKDDVRWVFGKPPAGGERKQKDGSVIKVDGGNANYAWIQHFIHHLAPNGIAGFVMANGSMSTDTSNEGEIRKAIIEADLVDCMIAMPGQLFYTTQIPVCMWFLSRSKKPDSKHGYRGRVGETLFIDARKMGSLIDRTHRELSDEEIAKIADTYHSWKRDPHLAPLPEGEVKTKEKHYRGGYDFSGLIDKARELRKTQTPTEAIMWELLRDRRFLNLKFRRQHQIGDYIADFYCDEKLLVIEIDGAIHSLEKIQKKDHKRDAYLKSQGISVLRFMNNEILDKPEDVLNKIAVICNPSTQNISPSGRDLSEGVSAYSDMPGFCKSATLADIREHHYVLTPGRYIGAEAIEDDGVSFEEKMAELSDKLYEQMRNSQELDEVIRRNLEVLGYGE